MRTLRSWTAVSLVLATVVVIPLFSGPARAAQVGPPALVVYEAGQDVLRASWAAPTDTSDPITGYFLTATDSSDHNYQSYTVSAPADAQEAVVRGLPEGHTFSVLLRYSTAAQPLTPPLPPYYPTTFVRTETGRRLADPPPANGQLLCGRLPDGTTRLTAAAGPVRLCHAGVLVDSGSTLQLDGTDGPLGVISSGAGGLTVRGALTTSNTGPDRGVAFSGGSSEQLWSGIFAPGGTVDLAYASVDGGRTGLTGWTDGRLQLDHVSFRDMLGAPLSFTGSADLRAVSIANTGTGASLGCRLEGGTVVPPDCEVSVTGSTFDRVVGTPLSVHAVAAMHLSEDLFTNTLGSAQLRTAQPTVSLTDVTLPDDHPLDAVRGSANALPVVLLRRVNLLGDVAWVGTLDPGTNDAPAPLSWVADGINVGPSSALTVPEGATMAWATDYDGVYHPGLAVGGGRLTVLPGATLTSVAALPSLCRSGVSLRCHPTAHDWYGITATNGAEVTVSGASLSWAVGAVSLSPSSRLTLTDTELGHLQRGIATEGSDTLAELPAGTLEVTGGSMHDVAGSPLLADGPTTTTVVGTSFARTGYLAVSGGAKGLADYGYGDVPTVTPTGDQAGSVVTLSDLTLDSTQGLRIARTVHPKLSHLRFHHTTNETAGGPLTRALTIVRSHLDPALDLVDIQGSGNDVDAISLAGVLTAAATWESPTTRTADGQLGWMVGGTPLTLTGDLTLPRGALVKVDPGGSLQGDHVRVDGTAGGALLTSTNDNTSGPRTCLYACTNVTWSGIALRFSDLALTGARVRGGAIAVSSDTASDDTFGDVMLHGFSTNQPVTVQKVTSFELLDSQATSVLTLAVARASIQRDLIATQVAVQKDGNQLGNPPYAGAPGLTDLTLKDVAVTGGAGPAFWLQGQRVTLGAGGQVDRLQGVGPAAVLFLDRVSTPSALTWVTPSSTPDLHPVGYVASTLAVNANATVPAGALVKAARLVVNGHALTMGLGAVLATPNDDTIGIHTCRYPYQAYTSSCPASPPSIGVYDRTVRLVLAHATGTASRITGAEIRGTVELSGTSNGSATPALSIDSSRVGSVSTAGLALSTTRSALAGLTATDADVTLTHTTVPAVGGRVTVSGGHLSSNHVVSAPASGPAIYGTAPWTLSQGADAALSCTSISGQLGGLSVDAGSVSLSQSSLFGNRGPSRDQFDLDNTTQVTSDQVWWGQPGGPTSGQVKDPSRLTDTRPLAKAPTCATATTVAPYKPASVLVVSPTADAVRVTWSPPADSRVQFYRVVAVPGGQSVQVPAAARVADVKRLPRGSSQRFVVTAHYAGGDVPSLSSVVVRAPGGTPAVTAFAVPPLVNAASASRVAVRASASPGTLITFTVGTLSRSARAGQSGQAAALFDIRGLADGAIRWGATPSDAAGLRGPTSTRTAHKDTTAPGLKASVPAPVTSFEDPFGMLVASEPGAVVQVSLYDQAQEAVTELVVGQTGVASYRHPSTGLRDGTTGTVTAIDTAGNRSAALTRTFRRATYYGRPATQVPAYDVSVDRTTRNAVTAPLPLGFSGTVTLIATADGGASLSRSVNVTKGQPAYIDVTPLPDGRLSVVSTQGDALLGESGYQLMAGPDVVRTLVATNVEGGVDLSWATPVDDHQHSVTGYGVAVKNGAGAVSIEGTTARIRDLSPGTDYEVTVVARSGDIPGLPVRLQVHTAG